MKLIIGYLYPDLMNIYGDTGNIIALKKRAEWRGIEVMDKNFTIGNKLSKGDADIFFFGGGQDQQQSLVASDLESSGKAKIIKQEIERGVPLLAICGGYQLLGEYYKPFSGPKLPGVGLFPAYTVASHDRMIGNIIIDSQFGKLVGFENHSGKTYVFPKEKGKLLRARSKITHTEARAGAYLRKGAEPLGRVISGFGNNGEDRTEGCVYKNAIGCYMHGSLLPKNPDLADWLLQKALEVKYGKEIGLETLNDALEKQAHDKAISRFA